MFQKLRLASWKRMLLVGMAIALVSELGIGVGDAGFRISLAVVLLPLFLLTLLREIPAWQAGLSIFGIVTVFRVSLSLVQGAGLGLAFYQGVCSSSFYVVYGILFTMLVPKNSITPTMRMPLLAFVCDFGGNMAELGLETGFMYTRNTYTFYIMLAVVAVVRSFVAAIIVAIFRSYSGLLAQAGHEERYQKLFLMKTDIKTEVYFMRKSSEQIENIVKQAYKLYEELSLLDIPEETKKVSLKIACDVHDIKKDYIRITQGLEKQVGESMDEDVMSYSNLVKILHDSTFRMNGVQEDNIPLQIETKHDFNTRQHYVLMSILKSLVNNSIEAIQSAGGRGEISIKEEKADDKYIFEVSDTGPGIAPDMIRKVFTMGFSTKYDEKSGNVARGMGLPGVKMAVQEHLHGTLLLNSQPGVATTFYIEIPAEELECEA